MERYAMVSFRGIDRLLRYFVNSKQILVYV
jgi:hypothetical protein